MKSKLFVAVLAVLMLAMALSAMAQVPSPTPITALYRLKSAQISKVDGQTTLFLRYVEDEREACPLDGPGALELSVEVYPQARGTYARVFPDWRGCKVVVRSYAVAKRWEDRMRQVGIPVDVVPVLR